MYKVTNKKIAKEYNKHPDTVRKRVKKLGGLNIKTLYQVLDYYEKKR